MAPGSNNPEYRDVMDVKEDLIEQGSELMQEIADLEAQQAAVVDSQKLDVTNSLPNRQHADTNSTWKALQDQIDANNMILDQKAADWVSATSHQLIKGTKEVFLRKSKNAMFDKTHPDEAPYSVFAKKDKSKTSDAGTDAGEASAAGDKKAEVVVTTRLSIRDLQGQVEAFKKDNIGLTSIAQKLLEAGLSPVDLVNSDPAKREAAITTAFGANPLLARYLIVELSDPKSTNRAAITATLEDMRTLLDKYYDASRTSKEFREKIEQGTIEGTLSHKLGSAVKELGKDPVALTAFIGALVGLGYFYYTREDSTKSTIKSALGWGVGIVGGTYLADFLWKKMDDRHRGLFDRIGMTPGEILEPEVVEKAKAALAAEGFPDTDQQSALDYARVSGLKMPVMNEAFQDVVSSGKREIDVRVLQKNGLDAASAKRIDGVSLYKVLEHFYGTMCYNASIKANPNAPTGSSLDDRMKLGLAYAQRHFPADFHFSNAVFEAGENLHQAIVAASSAPAGAPGVAAGSTSNAPAERSIGIEGIQDEHLAKLMEDHSALRDAVVSLGNGAYLIEGYPYSYQFNNGKHVFVQKLGATPKRAEIDDSSDAEIQITALLGQAMDTAKGPLAALAGVTPDKLSYNPGGYWEINPATNRNHHEGLSDDHETKTVPIGLQYDVQHPNPYVRLFAPGADPEYTGGIADAKDDYEKLVMLPPLVRRDVDHLLLGTGFQVKTVTEGATGSNTTTLTLEFSDGKTGTLIYKNNAIDSISLGSSGAAELEGKWMAAAQSDVEEFTQRQIVQDQLEKSGSRFCRQTTWHLGYFRKRLCRFKGLLQPRR